MTHFFVRACPQGHYEIDYRPVRQGQLCPSCGRQLIDRCPECGEIIKDWNFYGSSMMPPKAEDFVLPDSCPKCGRPLPWAGKSGVRVPNKQGR